MSSTSDLFRAGLDRLRAGDVDGYVALHSEDVEFEFPFAPPGRPDRVRGRDALRAYLEPLVGAVSYDEIVGLRVYETDAAGTIVVEMGARGRLRDTGRPFAMDYVAVVRSAGGRIVSYRDYWNPLALGENFGAGAA